MGAVSFSVDIEICYNREGGVEMIKVWYHGTNESSAVGICSDGIDFSKSRKELDNGIGFYITDDKSKALSRADMQTKRFNRVHKCEESPAIVEICIDEEKFSCLNIKNFEYCNDDWMRFVIANRLSPEYLSSHEELEHNLDCRYDAVVDSIADSNVSELASHVNDGTLSIDDITVDMLLTEDGRTLGLQLSLHTEEAIKTIKSKTFEIIKKGGNK